MTQNIPPNTLQQADVITPAEAKSWQEWADKAPAMLRDNEKIRAGFASDLVPFQVGAVAVGAALTIATLSKRVPGNWKWASGLTAAASFMYAAQKGTTKSSINQMVEYTLGYAQALEKDPKIRQELAEFLSAHVTADKVQRYGLEDSVVRETFAFGWEKTPFYQKISGHGELGR